MLKFAEHTFLFLLIATSLSSLCLTEKAFAQEATPIPTNTPTITRSIDFGDLPNSYTIVGEDAPAHIILDDEDRWYLGDDITAEQDGQPSPDGSADTADDGVTTPTYSLVRRPDGFRFLHLNITSGVTRFYNSGYEYTILRVGVWVDWDRNGRFTASEFHKFRLRSYPNSEVILVPNGYEEGNLAVRVRLFVNDNFPGETLDWTDFEGTVFNGEVEDYVLNGRFQPNPEPLTPTQTMTTEITIPDSIPNNYNLTGVDFGDLSNYWGDLLSYESRYDATTMTWNENVAFHTVSDDGQLRLGDTVTIEDEAQHDRYALGDSDDGVIFSNRFYVNFEPNEFHKATPFVSAMVAGEMPPNGATLGVWTDWDHSGTFGESEFFALNAVEGINIVWFEAPSVQYDLLSIRFRLFDNRYIPGGTIDWQDFGGAAINGEIEDYVIYPVPTAVNLSNTNTHSPHQTGFILSAITLLSLTAVWCPSPSRQSQQWTHS